MTITLPKSAGQFASNAVKQSPAPARVLPDLSALAEQNALLMQRLAEMEAKLAARASGKAMTFRVTDKGALSIYGLGRFPVTLYRTQWERILDASDDLRSFIAANSATLTTKAPTA